MMRLSVLVALAVIAAGCNGKKAEEAKAPPSPTTAAAPAVKPAPPPAAVPQPTTPVVVDEAMIEKYLTAQKTIVGETRAFYEQMSAEVKAAQDKDSTAAGLKALGDIDARSKKLDQLKRDTLAKVGLAQREYDATGDLVSSVEMTQMMFEKAGGEAAAAKMEADLKAQLGPALAKMPADERAKAEKDAMKMPESLRSLGQAKDARARYGDAAVDAVLKRLPEARALREELMGLAKK